MAEVFGVVAAATQLAGVSLKLIDLTANIKGATERLSKYQAQLQDLHDLSLSISQNPLLQTAEVNDHTRSLLVFVEHSSLEFLLQKNIWSRTWGFLRRDRFLSQTFNHLEQRKSSLSLLVSDLQARALFDIRSDLRLISEINVETPLSGTLFEKPPEPDPLPQVSASTAIDMGSKSCSSRRKRISKTMSESQGQREQAEAAASSSNAPQKQVRREVDEEDPLSIEENAARFVNNKVNSMSSGTIYIGQEAVGLDYMRNGHAWTEGQTSDFSSGSNLFMDNIMRGGGVQHNYSELPPEGTQPGGKSSQAPFTIYTGNKHINEEGQRPNHDRLAMQINGRGLDLELIKKQLGIGKGAGK